MTLPSCPYCGKPCKAKPNRKFSRKNQEYSSSAFSGTCGSSECIKKGRSSGGGLKKLPPLIVGKKPSLPHLYTSTIKGAREKKARETGLCVRCEKNPVLEGRTACEPCVKKLMAASMSSAHTLHSRYINARKAYRKQKQEKAINRLKELGIIKE